MEFQKTAYPKMLRSALVEDFGNPPSQGVLLAGPGTQPGMDEIIKQPEGVALGASAENGRNKVIHRC